MKPFVLLATRAEERPPTRSTRPSSATPGSGEGELSACGWRGSRCAASTSTLWSGILVGGGPFNASDRRGLESPVQRAGRGGVRGSLLDEVVARDFPFLGACYGIGALGTHRGGDRRPDAPRADQPGARDAEPEGPGRSAVRRTCRAVRGVRRAQGGGEPPPDRPRPLAVVAQLPGADVRGQRNMYATQFHPELDLEGICTRIEVYKNAGYFDPSLAETLKAQARTVEVAHPMTLLSNFVRLHRS